MAEQRRLRRLAAGPFHMLRKNALQVIIVQIAHRQIEVQQCLLH